MSDGNNSNVSDEELKTEEKDMEVSKDLDADDSVKEEEEEEEKEEEKVEEPAEEKKPSKKKVEVVENENEDEEPQLGLLERPVVIESGKREKRKVERLEISGITPNDKKTLQVPEGTGEKLGDCPRIEYQLNKVKSEDLKIIHRTLFDRPGSVSVIKKNIRKFNGFDFGSDDKRFEKKRAQLSKNTASVLKKMCELFDLERGGTKEDILTKLMNFLLEPKSSGKSVPQPKKKRKSSEVKSKSKPKKSSKKKSVSKKKKKKKSSDTSDLSSSESEEEKDDDEEEEEQSEEEAEQSEEEQKDSTEEEEEEEESEEEEKPKKKKKKQKVEKKKPSKKEKKIEKKKPTPKKPEKKSAPKKRKISESSSDSSDDEPIIKKKKSPPSDDTIHNDVKKILEGANLEEVTMKTVLKQVYAKYPDFDLTPRKEFIKSTVKQIIS